MKIVRSDHNVDAEIEALKLCRGHDNIVSFVEVIKDDAFTYIVTEWLAGVELFEYAIENELDEDEVREIFAKIVSAVQHMHKENVIHCDLKLENIKFTDAQPKNSNLKILDFGFAYRKTEPSARRDKLCCTLEYAAPEILSNQPFNESSDAWSLGVILYTLLCGHTPFLLSDERYNGSDQIARRIQKAHYNRTSNRYDKLSENAKIIIDGLLQLVPEGRIQIDDILNEDWFNPDDDRNVATVTGYMSRYGRPMPKPTRKSRLRIASTGPTKSAIQQSGYGDLYEPELEPVSDPEYENDHDHDMESDKDTDAEMVHDADHELENDHDFESELDHDQELHAHVVHDPELHAHVDHEQELEAELVTDLEPESEQEHMLDGDIIEPEYEPEQDLESEVVTYHPHDGHELDHEMELEAEPVHVVGHQEESVSDTESELEHTIHAESVQQTDQSFEDEHQVDELDTTIVNRVDTVDSLCNTNTLINMDCIELSSSERADDDVVSCSDADTVEYTTTIRASLRSADTTDSTDKTEHPTAYRKAFEHTTNAEIEATKDATTDLNGIYIADTIPENVENLNNNNEKYIETGNINVEEFVNTSMDMIVSQTGFEADMTNDNVIVAPKTNGGISPMPFIGHNNVNSADDDNTYDPYEFDDDEAEVDFHGFAPNDPSLLYNMGRLIDFRQVFAKKRPIIYVEPDREEYQEQVPAWTDVAKKRKYSESSESNDPSYSTRSKADLSCKPKRLRRRRAEIS